MIRRFANWLHSLPARYVLAVGIVLGAAWVAETQTPLTPIANLRGRTDSNGALYVAQIATWITETVITNTVSVLVTNLGPTSSSSYATTGCYHVTTASTNSINCADAAANFYGFRAENTTTTAAYLRLYNLATAPTCNSATGYIESIPIPPAAAAGQVGGIVAFQVIPTNYATGIGFCVTGGGTSTDNTASGAGIYIKIKYKE